MSVPFSYRLKLKKQAAILHARPSKNPVKHRMVNEPDQQKLLPSLHSMHMWFSDRPIWTGVKAAQFLN
jgi:hypothetical protein